MKNFDPRDWYWIVAGSTEEVWSSRLAAYVPIDHPDFIAHLAADGFATPIASEAALAEVLNAQYPAGSPTPPAPLKSIVRVAIARFTVAAGVVTATNDSIGVSAITRVSAGRYRLFFEIEDTDQSLLPAVTVRDAADVRARVSSRTATFCEVRVVNSANAAVDAAELIITFDKVVST